MGPGHADGGHDRGERPEQLGPLPDRHGGCLGGDQFRIRGGDRRRRHDQIDTDHRVGPAPGPHIDTEIGQVGERRGLLHVGPGDGASLLEEKLCQRTHTCPAGPDEVDAGGSRQHVTRARGAWLIHARP